MTKTIQLPFLGPNLSEGVQFHFLTGTLPVPAAVSFEFQPLTHYPLPHLCQPTKFVILEGTVRAFIMYY